MEPKPKQIWTPDNAGLIIPARSLIVRERAAPQLNPRVSLRPQHMRWQIVQKLDRWGERYKVVHESEQDTHNLVLNSAAELAAVHGFSALNTFAAVGTGNTAPAASQTALAAQVVRTSFVPGGESDGITRPSNGVYRVRRVKQFTALQVGGQNLAEWGFAPANTGNLMSRELFRDGSNNPVVLTLDADQELRIIYTTEITLSPTTQQNVSVNVQNLGLRSGKFITYGDASIFLFSQPQIDLAIANAVAAGSTSLSGGTLAFWYSASTFGTTYATNPSAQNGEFAIVPTINAYTANSKTRTLAEVIAGVSDAVYTVRTIGLASVNSSNKGFGAAIVFDAGQEIVKDNLNQLRFSGWGLSWT
jgi:hypothetical protein